VTSWGVPQRVPSCVNRGHRTPCQISHTHDVAICLSRIGPYQICVVVSASIHFCSCEMVSYVWPKKLITWLGSFNSHKILSYHVHHLFDKKISTSVLICSIPDFYNSKSLSSFSNQLFSQINFIFLLFHYRVALPYKIDIHINIWVVLLTKGGVILSDLYNAVEIRYSILNWVVLSLGLRGW
jgi:hypothetical protein